MTTGFAEGEEEEAERRRRRRGRRGGRGRRRAEETPPERTSSVPAREAVTPPSAPRFERERDRIPAVERERERIPAEVVEEEPRSAFEPERYHHYEEEEEFEEVGRPEGPLEERHVDPFGYEAAPSDAEEEEAPVERFEPIDEPAGPPARGMFEDAGRGPEGEEERAREERGREDEPESGRPEPPARPTYGRRSGRRR